MRLAFARFSTSALRFHGPSAGPPPQIPRRALPAKRNIPNVSKVLVVASGKGGVGKSTVAVNLAFSLALLKSDRPLRVGILDLDVFGPSIPTLMGLQRSREPELTQEAGAMCPITNHGIPTMSMAYLLPRSADPAEENDKPIVWRGLMVQKAVQQLLFDVDWTGGKGGPPLDVLVIDMPPGTGDVPLTLGQLVNVNGSVIVSTPQDVALNDVTKGVSMFRKVKIPITGIILNQSHFICPSCTTPHYLYGSPSNFRATAERLGIPVIAEIPVLPGLSSGGDAGVPFAIHHHPSQDAEEWKDVLSSTAQHVWTSLQS